MNAIVSYQTSLMKYNPQTLDEIIKLANLFEASGLFPAENSKTQSAAQLAVKILAGQELGFTPFAAANGMYIVKGKCAPGANLMAAKVKASGRYDYKVTEMTDKKVNIDFYENGKLVGASPFTEADAIKAQTGNMGKFPRNMLFARAMSNGVRWYCPDIFNGVAVYTADELGATVDYETGEIIESTVAEEQKRPAPELIEVTDNQPVISQDGPIEQKPEMSQARKRFHAEGTATFGKDWDNARHWLVERYTKQNTKQNIRTSSNDLSDDELDVVADTLVNNRKFVQDSYARRLQPAATGK